MASVTIFHNPRCSKSRSTLALLRENGVEPEVVLYLDTPVGAEEISDLLIKLDMRAAELVRRGEQEYKSLGLDKNTPEQVLIEAMASHPRLIERPIVVRGSRAVLGRPPENVLALLDD
ncbi:MAG: arsenate reductase (glutaredoxin) [Gammaproteobacteria bacterium]|nr:arsenate reductase (glutaredoxin) [Gammaproteobacteria bacterium]